MKIAKPVYNKFTDPEVSSLNRLYYPTNRQKLRYSKFRSDEKRRQSSPLRSSDLNVALLERTD